MSRFPEYVDNVRTLTSPDGVEVHVGPRRQPLRATPAAALVPVVWLLGSSDYSAMLAAERGLPYVFAHHFSGHGAARPAAGAGHGRAVHGPAAAAPALVEEA